MYGFCEGKRDNRIFRLSRIRDLIVKDKIFEPLNSMDLYMEQGKMDIKDVITIRLKFEPEVVYRVYDDPNYEDIKHNEDGTVEATISFPKGEWVYGHILSFGESVRVLGPKEIIDNIKDVLSKTLKNYL